MENSVISLYDQVIHYNFYIFLNIGRKSEPYNEFQIEILRDKIFTQSSLTIQRLSGKNRFEVFRRKGRFCSAKCHSI